jgi:hypothetical protein
MDDGNPLLCDLENLKKMINQSEINFGELRDNIRSVLHEQAQASIGQILQKHPATQGLGSVVGLLVLARRKETAFGLKSPTKIDKPAVGLSTFEEPVEWVGEDGVQRTARIPIYYFVRERLHDLDN